MPVNQFPDTENAEYKAGVKDAENFLPPEKETGLYFKGYKTVYDKIIKKQFEELSFEE